MRLHYPACSTAAPAAYLDPTVAQWLERDGFLDQEASTIDGWAARRIGLRDAAPCPRSVPLVTLSIGLGMPGALYGELAARLVEAGYAVAVIDHPYGGLARLPDGTVQSGDDDEALARIDEDPVILAARTAEWAADVSVTLDALLGGEVAIDRERLFAAGQSMGGAAALDACAADERLDGCVDMDGAPFGTRVLEEGLAGRVLVLHSDPLYDDEDLAARGRTREQWEAMGGGIDRLWSDLAARSDADLARISEAGTGHVSFSDCPLVLPEAITRFGGSPMEAARAMEVVSGALVAFLADAGGEPGRLDAQVAATPGLRRRAP